MLALTLCSAVPVVTAQAPLAWTDPSPHTVTLLPVDSGVQVELLDWGGSGRPIVLLAGLGVTAHIYDDLAPMLSSRYRVIGMTRRGHRGSSAALTGYDSPRLAEDVVRVIDATGLTRPVIVGHSFAGEEMHVLGARHAAKVAGLVYIDAAFNRADGSDDYDKVAATLPPAPRPGAADRASFATLRVFLEKTYGFAGPEAHLRTRYVANADGIIQAPWAPELPIRQAMTAAIDAGYKAYNPEPLRVPAVAIYAVPKSADDVMQRWYNRDDPAIRERVADLFRLGRESFTRHANWFDRLSGGGRVTEIAGPHDLFITHPREVLQQIDQFMSSIAGARR
jgi:pimeloyl-ACP methyl ester carboxylesterase